MIWGIPVGGFIAWYIVLGLAFGWCTLRTAAEKRLMPKYLPMEAQIAFMATIVLIWPIALLLAIVLVLAVLADRYDGDE